MIGISALISLSLACVVVVGVIGRVEFQAHAKKEANLLETERYWWTCQHDKTPCLGPSPASIEETWEQRERRDKILIAGLGVTALGCFSVAIIGGFRRPRSSSA